MKLKSLVLSALIAGAAAVSQGAAAQAIDRTVPLVTAGDGVGGFNAHFGDTFTASTVGSTFTDIFTFNIGTPFDASASVTSSFLNTPQTKDLLITSFSLYRYNPGTMAVLGTAIAGINETGFGSHPTDSWSLSSYGLTSGYYALRVDGQVLGTGGGAFGGDLTVSPVPEPATYGMLLAGLGLLGVAATRRKLVPRRI
ncbi:FxDxF family PEP-CTERM protein [Massilia norwichensis]|uniref:FxDxF family PEP-CTERM protein n=1 Tax=Massilia norwichensis TaxID=1442366 RepID=A0ABT2A3B7_9BURK|nr:FxDxF family PEP-CTERM protein [Massilia norwichensis]MCS0588682.1 FxDxF family PEP-CTERM protein [Massilia norwichensis]